MTDSHEVLAGVKQRVTKFSATGHFAASSCYQQASSWLLKSRVVFRPHPEVLCSHGPTAARISKPAPKFTPHSIPFTSDPGLRRWWKKGSTSAAMAKRAPSARSPSKKLRVTIPIPQGTTPRSSTNARGDTNTKFRPNTIQLQIETSGTVIFPELDTTFVNLKRIALTTSRCLCPRRPDAKNLLSMLTNPCLCKLLTYSLQPM